MSELPGNRAITLRNATCAYCGIDLARAKSTKEHVIGRRFVPKGNLDGSWNLIVNACEPCNHRKGKLENYISAVTLYTGVWSGRYDRDSALFREANRKARSAISPLTRKPVAESEQRVKVSASLAPGLTMTLNLNAPPQLDAARMFELARLQLMAFFYYVTFDPRARLGRFWRGAFIPILEAQQANWGNATHRVFMDSVVDWEPRFLGFAAEDHFAVIIRRHPSAVCWSWALEWNKQYRLIGLFGETEPAHAFLKELPRPKINVLGQRGPDWFGICPDVPLGENRDRLFEWQSD
jgi:hypothetical protein